MSDAPRANSAGDAAASDLLAGVRVIEVAGFVFAPIATAIMADLGADVVKVEPVTGDQLRGGRSGDADDDVALDGTGLLVELADSREAIDRSRPAPRRRSRGAPPPCRGCRRVRHELPRTRAPAAADRCRAHPGRQSVDRLCARQRLGLHRVRSATRLPSTSSPAWAGSGMASMMADHAGEPPSMPIGIFDLQAGSTLAGGIGSALYRRAVTGLGAVVDTALLNVGMWAVQTEITALPIGVRPGRTDHDAPHDALGNWYAPPTAGGCTSRW